MIVAAVAATIIILWSAYTLRAEGHGFSQLRTVVRRWRTGSTVPKVPPPAAADNSGPGCHLVEVVHSTPHSTDHRPTARYTYTERTP